MREIATLRFRMAFCLWTLLVCGSGGPQLLGQSGPDVSQIPLRGFIPTNSYVLADVDTVTTANGNLMLHIPLVSLPPSRGGMTAGVTLFYNSKLWEASGTVFGCTAVKTILPSPAVTAWILVNDDNHGGWRYTDKYELNVINRSDFMTYTDCAADTSCPSLAATSLWRYELVFPDGSVHALKPATSTAVNDNGYWNENPFDGSLWNCQTITDTSSPLNGSSGVYVGTNTDNPLSFYTTDSTYVRVDIQPGTQYNQWTATFQDGRKVAVQLGQQTITDRNGNQISIVSTVDQTTSVSTDTITDGVGRTIIVAQNPNTLLDTIQANGYGGTPLTWTVHWAGLSSTLQYWPYDVHSGAETGVGETMLAQPPGPGGQASIQIVTQVDIPAELDSGQQGTLSYTFDYGATSGVTPYSGAVRQMQLPSGATVSYQFSDDGLQAGSSPGSSGDYLKILNDYVATKAVTYPGIYSTENWSYAVSNATIGGNFLNSTGITAPDGGLTTEYRDANLGVATETVRPDGSTVQQVWGFNDPGSVGTGPSLGVPATPPVAPGINPFLAAQYTTLLDRSGNPSKTAIKTYLVDRSGNTVSESDYDFSDAALITLDAYNRPTGTGNANLIRTTTSVFNSDSIPVPASGPGQNLCTAGFYCDPGAATDLFSLLLSQTIASASASQYCYDSQGNRTAEAHWDSGRGGSSSSMLVDCTTSPPTVQAVARGKTYTYDGTYGNLTSSSDVLSSSTNVTINYAYGGIGTGGVTNLYPTQIVAAQGLPEQQTSNLTYDFSTGVKNTVQDTNGVTTITGYDFAGRPTSISKPGLLSQIQYDDQSRYVATTVSNGSGGAQYITMKRFDPLGRLQLSQQIEYPSSFSVADPTQGILVQYAYDDSTGTSWVSNPYRSNATSDSTMGWNRARRDTMTRTIEVAHFAGPTMPSATAAATGPATTSYLTNTSTFTDEAGIQRVHTVDGVGRLTAVTEVNAVPVAGSTPINALTNYTYDALDDLASVTQGTPNSQGNFVAGSLSTRFFSYDSLKRLAQAFNPESGTTNYSYTLPGTTSLCATDAGALCSKTDANSVTTVMTYDHLSRVLTKSYSGGADGITLPSQVTYEYDQDHSGASAAACADGGGGTNDCRGHITQVSNGSSTTTYQLYDALGQVVNSSQTTAGVAYNFGNLSLSQPGYQYSPLGEVISIQYPSGRVVNYQLDGAGRINQVQAASSTTVTYASVPDNGTIHGYAPQGAVQQMSLGANVEQTCFNDRLQVVGIRLGTSTTGNCQFAASNDWLNLGYTYSASNNNGNVLTQTIQGPVTGGASWMVTQGYTYDAANRLKTATEVAGGSAPSSPCAAGSTWCQTYVYDQYGNRAVIGGASPIYTPGNSDTPQVTADDPTELAGHFPNNQSDVCSSYDAAGNAKTCSASLAVSYTWDGENRLLTAGTVSFTYDGDGRRVSKTDGSTTTYYVYDAAGQLMAEYGGTPATSGTQYLTADHLGSTRMVATSGGNPFSCHDYLPFGEEIQSGIGSRPGCYGASDGVTEKFTGKERDAETGLDYFVARYLSSGQGRWMSPDWSVKAEPVPYAKLANPQSLNLYSYVWNGPLARADLDGHCHDHYKDGSCKVKVDGKTGEAGKAAGKQLEGVLNTYDKAVNALGDKAKFDIKDSKGNVIGSLSGKEIKAIWNGTSFTVTAKSFDNGGAGGGISGSWHGDSFRGHSGLNPGAVSNYGKAASDRNEAPLVGLSTLTFHELGHETHFGMNLTKQYPVTPTISWPRERATSSAGSAMAGAAGAPFDCSIGSCQ
jgi:RHS repeat-associated protein